MSSLSEICVKLGLPCMERESMQIQGENVLNRYRAERGSEPPKIDKRFTVAQVHKVYAYNDNEDLDLIQEEARKLHCW